MKHLGLAIALAGLVAGVTTATAMPTTGAHRPVAIGPRMHVVHGPHHRVPHRHVARHRARMRVWVVRQPAPMVVATAVAVAAPVEAPRPRCQAFCPGVMILGVGF